MRSEEKLRLDQSAALNFAHHPTLLEEWKKDLDLVHVGDDRSKVLAAVILLSSKRKNHEQALIIQKQSSAGGSNLQDALLEYFDNKIEFTRMTGSYLERSGIDCTGQILAIGELAGFDSSHPGLRQRMSEGKATLASTNRSEKGQIIAEVLKSTGRPCLVTTTTSQDIHPEFENRCWILGIDESQNQTKNVNKYQFAKDTFEYEGWMPDRRIKNLINSGVLKDLKIVNQFHKVLGENFPTDNVTARRDSKRFADLMTTLAYLYQYQRIRIKTKNQLFVLAGYEDLKKAIYYGQDALKNTLNKLNDKAESVLWYMKANKTKEYFTRNELCDALEIPYETMKRLLEKLVGRSFLELDQVDRIWRYKLRNKAMVEGISLGLESDFKMASIEYLKKHSASFEEIIMPSTYVQMIEIDKAMVDYLLSLGGVVTDENGNSLCTKIVPVTISPLVPVAGTNPVKDTMPVTKEKGRRKKIDPKIPSQ
jgi:hypothetical protein